MGLVMRWLRQPKLWITLASLVLIGIALVQQGGQLREQTLDARGWWWLLLGLGISWISILVNGAAWRLLLHWLGHLPAELDVIPLFVRSNLLKYLPGGIWHLVERLRVLRSQIGAGPALAVVVPGAPGGLGVFEATLLLRLGSSVAEAPLLAVVLSYRVISTLADLLAGVRWLSMGPCYGASAPLIRLVLEGLLQP